MKKLSKIKLQEAAILNDNEMKMVLGGSGTGDGGVTHTCLLKCGESKEDWYWVTSCNSSITNTCGGSGGSYSCTC